jgi:16S rRNA (cytosine1402-N4)-methyltransferase
VYIHKPVLLHEVIAAMNDQKEERLLIDATLGEGGHAEAFLSGNPRLTLLGIERDKSIMEQARRRLERFGPRVRLFRMDYFEFFRSVPELVDRSPQRIFFDLGVSMFHYQAGGRGFSFSRPEALDMRLDIEKDKTAADLITTSSEQELRDLIRRFGEERYASIISAAIVRERKRGAIEDSLRYPKSSGRRFPPRIGTEESTRLRGPFRRCGLP